jgi:hypothetical protein
MCRLDGVIRLHIDIFDRDWNLILNLGIKCNAAPISKRLGHRYISSPFDNMDSVDGFVEAGQLIRERFSGYFDRRADWALRNHRAPHAHEIRAKILWNTSYPGLYYPHFYVRWFEDLSPEDLTTWIADPEGTMDPVWDGMRKTFSTRQQRLVGLLERGNRVLFLRIEERGQQSRLRQRDLVSDLEAFNAAIAAGYPTLDFATLYFYCDVPERAEETERLRRTVIDRAHIEIIPADRNEAEFAEERLAFLKLLPRTSLDREGVVLEARI